MIQTTNHLQNDVKYALVFDADDHIVGTPVLPTNLEAPSYQMKIGEDFTYLREQILRINAGWRYRGVVHEVIGRVNQNPGPLIGGDYYIDSRRTGARNQDDKKYERDAAMIEEALKTEKGEKNHENEHAARNPASCGDPVPLRLPKGG